MANSVPTKVAFPSYPTRLIALENRLAGITNYHIDVSWLWIGAWHVIALAHAGRVGESRETCARMAGIIIRDR